MGRSDSPSLAGTDGIIFWSHHEPIPGRSIPQAPLHSFVDNISKQVNAGEVVPPPAMDDDGCHKWVGIAESA